MMNTMKSSLSMGYFNPAGNTKQLPEGSNVELWLLAKKVNGHIIKLHTDMNDTNWKIKKAGVFALYRKKLK